MRHAGSAEAASPTQRRRARRLAAAAVMLALACAGCDTVTEACDRSPENNPPILYAQGTVTDGVYESAPWDGELLYFPGGMRYLIQHRLGFVPTTIELYLSFDQYGVKDGGGTLTPVGGDPDQVVAVDAQTLTVVNGTCVEYWLRVVAKK